MPARFLFGLAFAAVLAWGAIALLVARPAPPHAYFADERPGIQVIAHRGGAGLRPESTLPLFERADILEIDLRAAADGAIVVIHDATVDRTTNGSGRVATLKLENLRQLDAGYRWTPDGGKTFPFRGKGLRVPTLAEVFKRHPVHRFVLELKVRTPEFAGAVCSLTREAGMTERVLAASFEHAPLAAFRDACPEVATSLSRRETLLFWVLATLRLEAAYSPSAAALQLPERFGTLDVLTPRHVRTAKARGLRVHAWTINDEESMRRLITRGVDGIMTDRPDRLLAVRGKL